MTSKGKEATDADVKLYEQSLLKASHIARYILISLINAQTIPYNLIFDYTGSEAEGYKILYGYGGISVGSLNDDKVKRLFFHFLHDLPAAKKCFEKNSLRDYLISLKEECVNTIKKSAIYQDILALVDILNQAYKEGRFRLKISTDIDFHTKSSLNKYEQAFLLMVLMPKVIKICGDELCKIDIYKHIIDNLPRLKNKALSKRVKKPLLLKIFDKALEELDLTPQDLYIVLINPLIRFEVPLDVLYRAVEEAYWEYIADMYVKEGYLTQTVELQELLPRIESKLAKRGYHLPPLSQIFDALKRIEVLDLKQYGEIWLRVGIPWYRGSTYPIPLTFEKPKTVSIDTITKLGIPLEKLSEVWRI